MTTLSPGERLGDWVIDRALGAGGMGSVHLAHSVLSTDVKAAVKTLLPSALGDVEARFVGEMRTLAALSHPSIVRVLGGGRDESRKLLYMAMELVDGQDLSAHLANGPLKAAEVARIFAPIADALRYAHGRGVFHRDIKPANLMLRADGTPVLVDFGIAVAQGQTRMTKAGTVPGTLAYLPPEIFQGDEPDPAHTDVYALGVTLYEVLTGTDAFPTTATSSEGQRMAAIMGRKVKGDALDPGESAGTLRDLVRGMTAPEPDERLIDLDTIVEVLEDARPASGKTAANRRTAPVQKRRRGWGGVILAVVAVLALLGAGTLAALAVVIAGGTAAWVAYQTPPPAPDRPPVDLAGALRDGASALEQGDLTMAMDHAARALDDHPADPNANLLIGQILLKQDRAALARVYLCAAVDGGLGSEVPGVSPGILSCVRGPGAASPVSARLAVAKIDVDSRDLEALGPSVGDALADAGAAPATESSQAARAPTGAPATSAAPRPSAPAPRARPAPAPRSERVSEVAAEPPPAPAPPTAPATAQPTTLDPAIARRIVEGASTKVQACLATAREKRPRLAGKMTLQIVIGPQGAVSGASVADSTLDFRPMEQCVVEVVQALTFPASSGTTVYRHTFSFPAKP